MAFEAVREYFNRHVFRRIQVHSLDAFILDLPETHTLRKRVKTHKIRPKVKVSSSKLIDFHGKLKCTSAGFRFSQELAKVRGEKIRHFSKHEVKVHAAKHMKKTHTWTALKRIQSLPQERANILKLQKKRPAVAKNEMILAWYSPIVDGAVERLVLDKQRGTLLVWYNPGSRQFKARGVYLIRRLGLTEKPEWRWV